jgi:hypothetical protein
MRLFMHSFKKARIFVTIIFLGLFVIYSPAFESESGNSIPSAIANQKKQPRIAAASLEEVVEDTAQPGLESSRLFPIKPALVQKDEQDAFIRELVAVQWRPGDLIYMYVILPKGVRNPPVVIYLYGYPSELDRFKNNQYCKALTEGGVAAAGFCSALTGHRYKNRPMKEWFVSELQEAIVVTVHDIQMTLDYLTDRNDLDVSRMGIFGQGSGGTIAILAAALDSRIRALDVINPWGSWANWMQGSALIPDEERDNYLKPDFLSRIAKLDPIEWLPKITDKPVRLQMIMSDPVNPEICLREILKHAPAKAIINQYQDTNTHAESYKNKSFFDWIKTMIANPGFTPNGAPQ